MSQVFSGDSVSFVGSTTITTTAETTAVTGNFLNPPFQNAKAMVTASVQLTIGAGTTSLSLRLHRNPNAENQPIMTLGGNSATAGNSVTLSVTASDIIPDGRPVQYALTVQQAGATGNGTIFYGNVSALLISG